jgi:hypothetical protein
MIDRRMAVYGYPLEIQALYFGMLLTALELLQCTGSEEAVLHNLKLRIEVLRSYVRKHYWVDRKRLNEIHRFKGEEFGIEVSNVLNVYPESIPDWMDGWLDGRSGYLVGNQGPGRVDFRFFAQGNLLAILFGLATESEAHGIAGEDRLSRRRRQGMDAPYRIGSEEHALVLPQRWTLAGPDLALCGCSPAHGQGGPGREGFPAAGQTYRGG